MGGAKYFGAGKMFDFRRIELFSLGYHLSRHKMTKCSRNVGALYKDSKYLEHLTALFPLNSQQVF